MSDVATRPEYRYDRDTIERALAALALSNNNSEQASRLLAKQGHKVPARTIRGWRLHEAERYHEIRTQVVDEIRQNQAEDHAELARLNMEAERKVLKRAVSSLDDLDPRDLSKASRDFSVGSGIHSQRAAEARGDASVIEHKVTRESPDILEKKLERAGVTFIEAEAVEVVQSEDGEEVPPAADSCRQ